MSKKLEVLTMAAGLAAMAGLDLSGLGRHKEISYKEKQSEESKLKALAKAEAKRARKIELKRKDLSDRNKSIGESAKKLYVLAFLMSRPTSFDGIEEETEEVSLIKILKGKR